MSLPSRATPATYWALCVCWGASACGGGPPSPPALAYDVPGEPEVTYDYSDTTVVTVSMMGQSMELSQRGTAEYAFAFGRAEDGVSVVMSVEELSAELSQPLGAPIRLDGADVDGTLSFSLDRLGNASLVTRPEVSDEASQMFSGLGMAHTFFPGLPGRAIGVGESWVDTVQYSGEDGPGVRSETSIFHYTATGDTTVAQRTLLRISLEGTTTSSNDMEIAGVAVSQTSELEVEGHVLWDVQRGVMFESLRSAAGSGSVEIPLSPTPLPITLRTTQRARLQQDG